MSVVTFPKYQINGLDAEAESARLHYKKNQPDRPDIDFPPYRFMPFPCALYRREGDEIVNRLCGVNDYDGDGNLVEALRQRNEAQLAALLGDGWVDTPADVNKARRAAELDIARAAAMSAYEDKNLGEKARAEREAVDLASDDHVVDVPTAREKNRAAKETR